MENDEIYIENYRLLSRLGSGAFGYVFKAQHVILTNRIVAIKLMRPDHAENEQAVFRFLEEAQILEKLKHPYILPIINAGICAGLPYQVAEYAPNGSLRDRLQRQPSSPLPIVEAITILSQVGQALQLAHDQNIIHRDLKPENILFNAKGEAIVADFGIATVLSTSSIKQTQAIGTYHYMAPEEYHDFICKESDQYALGCIAYELFTGHLPFQASSTAAIIAKHLTEPPISLRKHNPDLPEHIEKAVLKALAKERSDRYIDISAFITALIRPQAGISQEAKLYWDVKFNALAMIPGQKNRLIAACEEALQLDPNFANAYFSKGVALNDLKRYKEAFIAFENFLRIEQGSSLAWSYMGDLFKRFGKYEEAMNAYIKAKEQHKIETGEDLDLSEFDSVAEDDTSSTFFNPVDSPYNPLNEFKAYMNFGHISYETQHYKLALIAYDLATQFSFEPALAHYGKGMSLSMLGRYNEAVSTFNDAVSFNQNFDDAYNSMGIALNELHQYNEALAAFEHVNRLAPNKTSAWLYRAVILISLNRYREALPACQEIIRINPNSDAGYYLIGVAHSNLSNYREAIMAYEQAIRLAPENAQALNDKGVLLTQLDYNLDALLMFEQAIQIDPKDANFWRNKGKALFGMRQYKSAIQALEHAIKLNPKLISAYIDKGNALNILANFVEAFITFEQVTQLAPNHPDGYNGKGNALNSLNRLDEALAAFEQAIRLDATEAIFHRNRADVLQKQGRLIEAQQAYGIAKRLSP